MYFGRKRLGEQIRLGVQCAPGNTRTPTAPDAAPTFRIYTEAGVNVVNGSLPPREKFTVTGLFEYMRQLNSLFSTGRHYVRYQYAISSTNYVALDAFEIVTGGDTGGQVISMEFLDTPASDWILFQTDSGNTGINRGPHT